MRTRYYISADREVVAVDNFQDRPEPLEAAIGGLGYLTRERAEEELALWLRWANGEISDCEYEFGPHDDHTECEWLMQEMSPDYPDETDYSGWYGGERGYQDGLRWSDFV